MANFQNLFPNLTDSDFIAAGTALEMDNRTAAEIAAGRQKVDDWAMHGSDAIIPAYRLPNIAIGDVHTITLSNAETTDDAGVPTVTDLVNYLNSAAAGAAGLDPFHEGDIAIVTGTTSTDTAGAAVTFLFTNGDINGKTPGTTGGFIAGDFAQIASSAVGGVTSLTANNSLTVDMSVGTVTINLDSAIHANEGDATFTVGQVNDGAGTPTDQATEILGTGITATSTASNLSISTATSGNINLNSAGSISLTSAATSPINISAGATSQATLAGGGSSLIVSSTGLNTDSPSNLRGKVTVGITDATGAGHDDLEVHGNLILGDTDQTVPNTVTIHAVAASTDNGGNIDSNDTIVVLEAGVVKTKTLASIGVGAYSFNTYADTAPAGDGTDFVINAVNLIAVQSADRSIALPTGTTAGQWIKIINDNVGSGQTITLTSTQGFLSTADTTVVLDDPTANFELIYTGVAGDGWAIMTT